jgi:pimeloyl-ACP methyl ester carboxylesterase
MTTIKRCAGVFVALLFSASEARAACTMPAGTIELYAGPGSHVAKNICAPNAMGVPSVCNLSGWLYQPPGTTTKRPVLLYVQGSGVTKNQSQACSMISYFVAQKFIVWVPYMRGYADTTKPQLKDSHGTVVVTNANPTTHFTNSGTYIGNVGAAQTVTNMIDEVDHEIQWSLDYLKVKYAAVVDTNAIVLAGHSYGGATVALAANRALLPPPAAIIDMSGGVLSWYNISGSSYTPDTVWFDKLCPAVKGRKMPMLFFQVMNETPIWKLNPSAIDAVASTQKIYDCAIGGADPTHAEMMIYSLVPPSEVDVNGPWCQPSDPQNQCVHTTFLMDPRQFSRWGAQMLDFLAHNNINP